MPERYRSRVAAAPLVKRGMRWIRSRYGSHDELYDARYFSGVDKHAQQSARAMAESIVADFAPARVVDVGCGTGALLAELQSLGVEVRGLEYAEAALACCRGRGVNVTRVDLEGIVGTDVIGRCDVAVSQEVAEHLPGRVAGQLVALLCQAERAVVFGAARPGQGGTDHVNEQPLEVLDREVRAERVRLRRRADGAMASGLDRTGRQLVPLSESPGIRPGRPAGRSHAHIRSLVSRDMDDFEERIARLDTSLFDAITSQSTVGDKRSWLALQAATRHAKGKYAYLEIGSYLGGSIQTHALDPMCRVVFSIDKRPLQQPDDRGAVFDYRDSSTARMLRNLRTVAPDQLRKIVCFDSDAKSVDPRHITAPPDLCFIDGEHTRQAVLDDFEVCAKVCAPDAVIYFHDAQVIHPAIAEILETLKRAARRFTAVKLEGLTFAIAMGGGGLIDSPTVRGLASGGEEYLRAMRRRASRERIARYVPASFKPALRTLRSAFTRT